MEIVTPLSPLKLRGDERGYEPCFLSNFQVTKRGCYTVSIGKGGREENSALMMIEKFLASPNLTVAKTSPTRSDHKNARDSLDRFNHIRYIVVILDKE